MKQISDWLQRGVQAHQQGRADEAARCYQEVLARVPKQPDALHLSGVLALQRGELKQAEKLINKAIKVNPQVADYHSNLGEVLRQLGQPAAAKRALLQAIKLQPDHVLCLNNLGLVAGQLKQRDDAQRYYQRALALRPDYFEANFNLAQLLATQGDATQALDYFARAAAARPDYPPLLLAWGNALRRLGRHADALSRFDALLALQPGDPAALANRGECLLQLQRYAEAEEALVQALACDAQLVAVHSVLGVVRMEQDDAEGAVACFERALAIDPGDTQARLNLAQVERERRQLDRARQHYELLLKSHPNMPEAHFGRAMVHLAQGNWRDGWADYEWRFDTAYQAPRPQLDTPRWRGEPVGGRLLVLTEQGFGDNLMAWRFLPPLAERFDEVWVQAPKPLAGLAERLPGVSGVCAPDQFPEHDYHCSLLSLPHCLALSPDLAGEAAYLQLPEGEDSGWRERVAALGEGLKVGLCWSGGALNPKNRKRHLGLEPLRPLFALAGVQWVSLQKESSEAERRWLADAGVEMADWMAEMSDFRATAGLVASLDLVISLDSAVAHLAGVLGGDCWTLVPYYHDWRWQLDGDKTSWYPRMTLFRQQRYGDGWASVVDELTARLRAEVDQRRSG